MELIEALNDPELTDQERGEAALVMFYPDFLAMPPENYQEAITYCLDFIAGGEREETAKKSPQLISWKKDFPLIVAPVNKVLGFELRAAEYVHWWTFLAAFHEIGECTFSQVVKIRDQLSKNKPLNKDDRAWYNKNRKIVDIPTVYTSADMELFKMWGGAKNE